MTKMPKANNIENYSVQKTSIRESYLDNRISVSSMGGLPRTLSGLNAPSASRTYLKSKRSKLT